MSESKTKTRLLKYLIFFSDNCLFNLIILVFIAIDGFILFVDNCFALEQRRFHSQSYGYSFVIPNNWIELSDDAIQELSRRLLSIETVPKIIETGFQRSNSEYPRVIVLVLKYSSFGMNRRITKSELKEIMNSLADDTMQYTSFDFDNGRCVQIVEFDVPGLGKIKSERVSNFGGYAMVQLLFTDLNSDWYNSQADRDLIKKSFKFEPGFECSFLREDILSKKKGGVRDLIVEFAVYGIIALSLFLLTFISRTVKSKKNG